MTGTDFIAALEAYDYPFPPKAIANEPSSPRDRAKLLIFKRADGSVNWSTVAKIGDVLPEGTVLVRNITKVIPAKLVLIRQTGGKVEALVTSVGSQHLIAMANRKLQVGEELMFAGSHDYIRVEESLGQGWRLVPIGRSAPATLQKHGHTPLPPYMKDSPLTESQRREKYQSVFAKDPGSIAAPTASLHFTPRLLTSLKKRGVTFIDIVLHVNLGTFAPLTEEQWRTGKLHHEHFSIPPKSIGALEKAKKDGKPIIPIGTTALRAIESAASTGELREHGVTDLFIRDGYEFRLASGLMTNFHVPKSSLLMLVGAMVGRERLLELYQQALKKHFRFFSFGDAMLIL